MKFFLFCCILQSLSIKNAFAIIGGRDTEISEVPHQLSLENYGSHMCGASILTQNWVLTAGHCVDGLSASSISVKTRARMIHRASKIIVHPEYSGLDNDIAIIKLDTPIQYDSNVGPVTLPKVQAVYNGPFQVFYGWNPLKVVKYVDKIACNDALKCLTGSSPVLETKICTKPREGGNEGGPRISKGSLFLNESLLVGIVAWGSVPCGTDAPSVYTGISGYNDWIERIMRSN